VRSITRGTKAAIKVGAPSLWILTIPARVLLLRERWLAPFAPRASTDRG